jgi:nicotinate-nucleotide adenylyltransferase
MSCGKNILVFGGTFSPIHFGHLILARTIMEESHLGFEKCYLIPNGDPPHKTGTASGQDRLKMCQLAVDGDPRFLVSDCEVLKEGKSYTLETAQYLKEVFRGHDVNVWWIIGPDNFADLMHWHRFCDFAGVVNFVVGYSGSWVWPELREGYRIMGIHTDLVEIPRIDIRSTLIRQRIQQGLPITYLVPQAVETYIKEQGLYGCRKI